MSVLLTGIEHEVVVLHFDKQIVSGFNELVVRSSSFGNTQEQSQGIDDVNHLVREINIWFQFKLHILIDTNPKVPPPFPSEFVGPL
jgi:hypothetical protein